MADPMVQLPALTECEARALVRAAEFGCAVFRDSCGGRGEGEVWPLEAALMKLEIALLAEGVEA